MGLTNLWVEDRDHSHHSIAEQPLFVFDCWFSRVCMCVLTVEWNLACRAPSQWLFDLQTTHTRTHTQLIIVFSCPCSFIFLCQSSCWFSLFSIFTVLFPLLATFLSPLTSSLHLPLSFLHMWFILSHSCFSLLIYLFTSFPPSFSVPLPSLFASLAGCSLQWVSIMEAGSGAAAAVGSAALGLLGVTTTSSHDILDR